MTATLRKMLIFVHAALLTGLLVYTGSVWANGNSENTGWQFSTSTDKANKTVTQDMIQKRVSGYYASPTYTTTIGRQFNCNVTATATGNLGSNSALANSPSTSGATSSATGNSSASSLAGLAGQAGLSSDSTQANSGSVGSGVNGSTTTNLQGLATQALNSSQTNSGAQSASTGGSAGCAFGALN